MSEINCSIKRRIVVSEDGRDLEGIFSDILYFKEHFADSQGQFYCILLSLIEITISDNTSCQTINANNNDSVKK